MLVIQRDGPLDLGELQIEVASEDKTLLSNVYRVPQETGVPTTVAIVSNGRETGQATIAVVGWQVENGKRTVPLDRRDAIVVQIPTNRVASLPIVLSARCTDKVELVDGEAQSTCPGDKTCDPASGDCSASIYIDARELPDYQAGDENRPLVTISPAAAHDAGSNQSSAQLDASVTDSEHTASPVRDAAMAIESIPTLDGAATEGPRSQSLGPSEPSGEVTSAMATTTTEGTRSPDLSPSGTAGEATVTSVATGTEATLGRDSSTSEPSGEMTAVTSAESTSTTAHSELSTSGTPGEGTSTTATETEGSQSPDLSTSGEATTTTEDIETETLSGATSSAEATASTESTGGSSGSQEASTSGVSCGDGELDQGETCDDANVVLGDGCDDQCVQEVGWSCSGVGCVEQCGDGQLVGAELVAGSCDDQNPVDGDGCSSSCRVEAGYSCRQSPSLCETGCGDGQTTDAEVCDDGNSDPGDGCFACQLEPGATCDTGARHPECVVTNDGLEAVHSANICGERLELLERCAGGCVAGECRCVVRVTTSGGGDSSGADWLNPMTSVSAGMDAAETRGCEVWVAAGTYLPDGIDRTATFQLRSGVALYGGFVGTEQQRNQRDWIANETIFTGGGDGVGETSGVYHVVTGANQAVMDGFTVVGGNAAYAPSGEDCGGGLINKAADLVVRNSAFKGNRTRRNAAGICNLAGNVVLENVVVQDGRATFLGEFGVRGLGVYNQGGSVVLRDCSVRGHRHGYDAGASGTAINNSGGRLELYNSTVSDNRSCSGAVYSATGSELIVRGSRFELNGALDGQDGGAIQVAGGTAVIVQSDFVDNLAGISSEFGGAIAVDAGATVSIASSRFVRNSADSEGGAIFNAGTLSVANTLFQGNMIVGSVCRGGAIANNGTLNVYNSTFVENDARDGGAGIYFHPNRSGLIANSIFWGNSVRPSAGVYRDVALSTQNTVQLFNNTFGGTDSCPAELTCPVVDPGLQWVDDYPIPTSPGCIDAGNVDYLALDEGDLDQDGDYAEPVPFDLRGGARIQGAAVDIGAIEVAP